jgi:hypothetical protein
MSTSEVQARKFMNMVNVVSYEVAGHDNWDRLYSAQRKLIEDMLNLQSMPVHGGVAEVIVIYKNESEEV